ncbi:MAG: sulfur carrier protein ThiS [Thiomicrorhabdus chilensis]|uniref:sulfur carrier protein ThiS n=1 Tax=Thiomicrorhabdus chilensis TaxID=63656 RepID=UPI00299F123B|nr:sulfur carrier protein ThiS [Thiomicrorhabdus chilensis]MDX1347210.1 sulfur carrier protein ThiS [Thiomicrorhabdus chilensis]
MTDTFQILVNATPQQANEKTTLAQAAVQFGAQPPYVLLLNHHFIASSQHDQITLKPNDIIEVISAIQGG